MIRPHLNYSIHIKNLYTYRDFLKKRPKHAHQFKFTMAKSQQRMNQNDEKIVQLKLLRALKTFKSVPKVDFKDCIIEDYGFWKPRLLSAYKKISRVKTLVVVNPRTKSEIKDFKYFPQLKHIIYQLGGYYFASQNYDRPNPESERAHNYLKYLKYSPKVNSFNFADYSTWHFPKIGTKGRNRFKTLETLVLKKEKLIQNEFGFPIKLCKNLKSISFKFDDIRCSKSLTQMMEELPNLSNLQEICMSFNKISKFDFLSSFKSLAKKGILKKVKFDFGGGMLNLDEILDALEVCQLTHFSLKTFIKEGLFQSIAQFIQNMGNLESFGLHIVNPVLFSNNQDIIEICKQINKLQALQHLKLDFETLTTGWKSAKISNFIPYLSDVLLKTTKIETLHIGCLQLDPSETLQSLMPLLEDSADFLTHLRINLRALTCNKNTYRLILKFLQKLSNIQVLEIPCLGISGSSMQFFNEIADKVYEAKFLRVLEIGRIRGAVNLSACYQTVETISSKRGLRKFHCSLCYNFQRRLLKEGNVRYPNIKRIIEKNPYLGTLDIRNDFHCFRLDLEDWEKIYPR